MLRIWKYFRELVLFWFAFLFFGRYTHAPYETWYVDFKFPRKFIMYFQYPDPVVEVPLEHRKFPHSLGTSKYFQVIKNRPLKRAKIHQNLSKTEFWLVKKLRNFKNWLKIHKKKNQKTEQTWQLSKAQHFNELIKLNIIKL